MTELTKCFRLDLTDSLTGDVKLLAHILKGVSIAVIKTETELENVFFSGGEGVKHLCDLILEQLIGCLIRRCGSFVIGDEVAEVTVLLLTYGSLKGNGILSDLEDLTDLFGCHIGMSCDLLGRSLVTEFLKKLT